MVHHAEIPVSTSYKGLYLVPTKYGRIVLLTCKMSAHNCLCEDFFQKSRWMHKNRDMQRKNTFLAAIVTGTIDKNVK